MLVANARMYAVTPRVAAASDNQRPELQQARAFLGRN